jgi:structural maintenance of chromosome 4
VQAAAALAVKDLAANERQEIALQERRKHADGKTKKLKKSLKEVDVFHGFFQY